jgi:hypothetical protein
MKQITGGNCLRHYPDRTSPLYDVSADGQRFAVLTADRTKSSSIRSLLTNWPAELKK